MEQDKLVIRVEDTLAGLVRRIPVDMVVLSTGLEAREDADDVRRMFNMSCSSEGWFLERHPKLAPVSTFTDGVFIAGCAQGPKDIPDTVAQAGAAAAEAMALIDTGQVELEAYTAWIDGGALLGLPDLRAALPVQRHRVQQGEEGVRAERGALQGLRHLRRGLPVARRAAASLHRRPDHGRDRGRAGAARS